MKFSSKFSNFHTIEFAYPNRDWIKIQFQHLKREKIAIRTNFFRKKNEFIINKNTRQHHEYINR